MLDGIACLLACLLCKIALVESLFGLLLLVVDEVGGKEHADDEHDGQNCPEEHFEHMPTARRLLLILEIDFKRRSVS